MGNEQWCEIGDMPAAWCSHCRGVKSPEEEATLQEAEYDRWLDQLGQN